MSQVKKTQQAIGSTSTSSTGNFRTVASFSLQFDGNDEFRLSMTESKPVIIPRLSPSIFSADKIDTRPPQQDSLDPFFERFFPNVIVITTLGSSITLALIVSQLQDPEDGTVARHSLFDLSTVRILIATSWLLFTVTLILSFFLAGWLKHLQGKAFHSASDGYWMVALLYFFIMGAFICLSLAVAAYVDVIGFIAVAILGTLLSLPIVLYLLGSTLSGLGFAAWLEAIRIVQGVSFAEKNKRTSWPV